LELRSQHQVSGCWTWCFRAYCLPCLVLVLFSSDFSLYFSVPPLWNENINTWTIIPEICKFLFGFLGVWQLRVCVGSQKRLWNFD
jgi:hypothetical protein